jgi:energy-coupling factor transporter ATP-binding protein EcfA2
VELHPGTPPAGRGLDRAELARLDAWLALAETLSLRDPYALHDLGFFGADQKLLASVIEALRRTTDTGTRVHVEAVLERIRLLAPRHWVAVDDALESSRQAALDAPEWWVPEDLQMPPSIERVAPGPVEFTRDDVARVLEDL